LKAILILLLSVSVSKHTKRYNMQTQTNSTQAIDVLQQFDALLKNHSIVVTDRENLAKLFQSLLDLCTQMPKTKLKAAIKAATATQEPKTAKPRAKAQPKPKTNLQTMVGPEGAADAPVISDIVAVPVARGRGRPRKADTVAEPVATAATIADANPNAETAEKKRRGRPKKDKSVTISSNDDEDALIAKMMADVASMQKDEAVIAYSAEVVAATVIAEVVVADVVIADADVVIADPATDDDETEDEACSPISPIQTFAGPLMRCEETTPVAESMSPVVPTSSPSSFQTFDFEVEVPAPAPKATKAAKEPKAKVIKAPKEAKAAKEPKAKAAAKEPKVKETKAKEPKAKAVSVAVAEVVAKPLASFAATPIQSDSRPENQETNGGIYLMSSVPTASFTYNGKTYLRTETDNVYDNLTYELIGVWDHSNHEIIATFDDEDDELYFSDEE
jgi:hypothetical protein